MIYGLNRYEIKKTRFLTGFSPFFGAKTSNFELYCELFEGFEYGKMIGFREDIYKQPYQFPPKVQLTHKSTEYLEPAPIDNIYYLGKKGFEWIIDPKKNLRRSRVNQDIIGCETAYQQDNWIGDFRVERPQQYHREDERIYIGKYDFKDGEGMVDAVGRKMTPRECMNLMGFDNTFRIVVNDSIAYRHAGNSIVVPVLKAIINSILSYLQ